MRRTSLFVFTVALMPPMELVAQAASDTLEILIDESGKTLQVLAGDGELKTARLRVRTNNKDVFARFRLEQTVTSPGPLPGIANTQLADDQQPGSRVAVYSKPKDLSDQAKSTGVVCITYNIVHRIGVRLPGSTFDQNIKKIVGAHQALKAENQRWEEDAKIRNNAITAMAEAIERLSKRIDQLAVAGGTVAGQLPQRQAELSALQGDLDKAKAAFSIARKEHADRAATLTKELRAFENKIPGLGEESLDEIETWSAEPPENSDRDVYVVKKVGTLLLGSKAATAYYGFAYGARAQNLRLERFQVPVITQDHRVFANVGNRIPEKGDCTPVVNLKNVPGKAPDPDPWRGGVAQMAREQESVFRGARRAYWDSIHTLGGPFRGNDVLSIQIQTSGRCIPTESIESSTVETADKKTVTVTSKKIEDDKLTDLLNAELTQVRALYRWTFVTGAIATSLGDRVYSRIPTGTTKMTTTTGTVTNTTTTVTGGPNPGTTNTQTDQTVSTTTTAKTYSTQERVGGWRVKPVGAFGIYPFGRVDTQRPHGLRDLLPAAMVGFDISSPGDNVFFGLSHEIRRNVQLYWGQHFGQVPIPAVVQEVTDAAAPTTDKRWRNDWFVGLTMNVNAIAKIFKLGF